MVFGLSALVAGGSRQEAFSAEAYGWEIFPRFFSIFWPPDELLGYDADNEQKRATFFIAAMSAAVGEDLRGPFRAWGLPCLDDTYEAILPELSRRAAQRD